MIVSVNLSPEEMEALSKTSAVTGLSVDEVIRNAILKVIEGQMPEEKQPAGTEPGKPARVYKEGVDPYAPVFEESDWEMLADLEKIT
jgi:hypothetical protein